MITCQEITATLKTRFHTRGIIIYMNHDLVYKARRLHSFYYVFEKPILLNVALLRQ